MENDLPKNSEINFTNRIPLEELQQAVNDLKQQLGKVIIGQERFVELLIAGLLANGHVLIEGVPGVAKTVTAKLFAKTLETDFSRIQFTPDLMPSDVLGTSVLNAKTSGFEFKAGPIFSNIVLIDEINRAPAKTQAALFEVMEERQITIDGKKYAMKPPFMVVATQNPIEQEGTYALPEAQLDRFLFKIKVEYPTPEEEVMILQSHHERKGCPAGSKYHPGPYPGKTTGPAGANKGSKSGRKVATIYRPAGDQNPESSTSLSGSLSPGHNCCNECK
jgi:MoxR-like ATPase